ncbi:MAG: hypothetical protein HQM01_11850 [Magnetococcales bacterium]|nr:hypothetical protein [Magnetococcales bacterium]
MLFLRRFAKDAKRLKKTKAAHGAFFAKTAKNAFCKERAKSKVKTLGEESPRLSLFFQQYKLHIPSRVRFEMFLISLSDSLPVDHIKVNRVDAAAASRAHHLLAT